MRYYIGREQTNKQSQIIYPDARSLNNRLAHMDPWQQMEILTWLASRRPGGRDALDEMGFEAKMIQEREREQLEGGKLLAEDVGSSRAPGLT